MLQCPKNYTCSRTRGSTTSLYISRPTPSSWLKTCKFLPTWSTRDTPQIEFQWWFLCDCLGYQLNMMIWSLWKVLLTLKLQERTGRLLEVVITERIKSGSTPGLLRLLYSVLCHNIYNQANIKITSTLTDKQWTQGNGRLDMESGKVIRLNQDIESYSRTTKKLTQSSPSLAIHFFLFHVFLFP